MIGPEGMPPLFPRRPSVWLTVIGVLLFFGYCAYGHIKGLW